MIMLERQTEGFRGALREFKETLKSNKENLKERVPLPLWKLL